MTISREAQSIIDYIESTGLPYRVTDVNGPGHAKGSYHYRAGTGGDGLAVDFAGTASGITAKTEAQMFDIWRAFWLVQTHLAELIHSGAGITKAVKNGQPVDGRSFYGPLVWPDHRDHVHVAVLKGTFLLPMSHPIGTLEGGHMADDPNIPNAQAPIAAAFPSPTGKGYTIVTADGAVYCFGDAEYHGRLEAPVS